MRLLFKLDTKDYDPMGERVVRPSVRGIIIQSGKVAMVYSQKYHYYKSPGGGMEPGESHIQTLLREVAEESGLQVIPESIKPYGHVHRVQKSDHSGIFVQDNYYYLCQVEDIPRAQVLDPYEAEEGFTLEFVDPCHAENVNRYEDHGTADQVMLEREAMVLDCLRREGYFSRENPHSKEYLLPILNQFGISDYSIAVYYDSSHGEKDIRHNYVIDNQYVLRMNTAKVMTDSRLHELNELIGRYRDFGMKAPLFLKNSAGGYLVEQDGMFCYLSECLDDTIAQNVKYCCCESLQAQRIAFISRFAQQYKNVGLISTRSMYSIFELSPYDAMYGIEEKLDNFQNLMSDMKALGEYALAQKLEKQYFCIRRRLQKVYRSLPQCVFQGDENYSNLCVDEENRIIGLFDFNMSGTEVIANYLANAAFNGNFHCSVADISAYGGEEIFQKILESYRKSTQEICQYYSFTPEEYAAYEDYARVVLISGYAYASSFCEFLKISEYRPKVLELIHLISEQFLGSDSLLPVGKEKINSSVNEKI